MITDKIEDRSGKYVDVGHVNLRAFLNCICCSNCFAVGALNDFPGIKPPPASPAPSPQGEGRIHESSHPGGADQVGHLPAGLALL
ncbi:MAG: hypothetical protein M0P58_10845 [Bacteroidales bacterium]|nr:hypothetical protein [Bacteroidales bacterium]